MIHRPIRLALALLATGIPYAVPAAPAISVSPVTTPQVAAKTLPTRVVGRAVTVEAASGPSFTRQWPGTYFETRFRGTTAYFQVGAGNVILHVIVDGRPVAKLVKPQAGLYRIDGLTRGNHRVRVAVGSESQAAPTHFGGFYAAKATFAPPPDRIYRRFAYRWLWQHLAYARLYGRCGVGDHRHHPGHRPARCRDL
jgi:hypothetical protein